jgi:uncharacterized membrane protein YhhN
MVALIVAAIAGSAGVDAGIRWAIVAGLVLSLAGDVFLMLDDRWFLAGLGAFLLAHLAYIVGIIQVGLEGGLLIVGLAAVAVLGVVVGRVIVAGAASRGSAMRLPVAAYVTVISAMVATGVGTGEPWLIAAALLFYSSDAVLGWERFIHAERWMGLAVMVTYHLAQACFTLFLVTR